MKKKVLIWDETLRDGEQTPGVNFSAEQKLSIAKLLTEMGVDIIDVGFPSISEDEREAIKLILNEGLGSKIGAAIRVSKDDIELAHKIGLKNVFIFSPTSEILIKHKFGLKVSEYKNIVINELKHAIDLGLNIYYVSEDTSRSNQQYIIDFFSELYELGIDKMLITDTVGIMSPTKMKAMINRIIQNCNSDISFGIHCHNDFGLATANTLAAVEEGVVYVNVTVNGIGERAGNASFEETIMALERIYQINTGIDIERIPELSKLVEIFSGIPVQPNKAIVGHNAFRHEAGIHVNALMKSNETYQAFPPSLLKKQHEFVLGKHSGGSLIKNFLKEKGIFEEDTFEKMLTDIKSKRLDADIRYQMYLTLHKYYEDISGTIINNMIK